MNIKILIVLYIAIAHIAFFYQIELLMDIVGVMTIIGIVLLNINMKPRRAF